MSQIQVVLNVYELPISAPENEQLGPYASLTSFFSKVLPSAGFGAYHTSIDVGDSTYSFAVGGISKTSSAHKHRNLPAHATFQESIVLGTVSRSSTDSQSDVALKIQKCLDYLRTHGFAPNGYHLAYRNCNHFTETLATALVLSEEELLANPKGHLKTYPGYINRLARTGSTVLDPKADAAKGVVSGPCDPPKEAREAIGIHSKQTSKPTSKKKDQRRKKKELTEAQKKILAKLKTKK